MIRRNTAHARGWLTIALVGSALASARAGAHPHDDEEAYKTIVRGKRPPRSASDWTFRTDRLGVSATGSAGELLRQAPGVFISQHSGEGKAHQIFLRGFDAVHGQDLEIHVGGIPVNEVSNVHAQGYADLHFVFPEVVSRMRVLEGAFDPRQGDFAVAGSIDLELGMARRGLLLRGAGGQHGVARGVVAWAPEGEPEETFVAAELARGDGFGPSRAYLRGSALGQLLHPVGERILLRLLASTHASRFDSAGVVRVDDLRAGTMGLFDSYDPHQGGAGQRHQALIEATLALPAGARASLATYVVVRDLLLRHNFTGFLRTPRKLEPTAGANRPLGDLIEQVNESVTVGGSASYRRPVSLRGRDHRLELGLVWRHDRVEQSQERLRAVDQVPWEREVEAALRVTDLALFADLELELHRRLRVRGGLRVDSLAYQIHDRLAAEGAGDRREAFGFHVGPKLTVELRARDWLRLFASYGNGFRSPQALALGQGEQAPFAVVHAGELGVRLDRRRLGLTLSGFVTQIAEDFLFDHATGRLLVSGPTLRAGATLLAELHPVRWLAARGSATFAEARRTATGERLPYAPPLVLRLDLDGKRHVARLRGRPLALFGSVGIGLVGPRPLPFDEQSRAVTTVDAAIGAELGPASLALEGFNLADARYRDGEFVYASSFRQDSAPSLVPARHVTAGRPLSLQGTLTFRF